MDRYAPYIRHGRTDAGCGPVHQQVGASPADERFKDYLRTVPEVSSDLPQGLTNFFLQAQIPLDEAGVMATINQTILPPLSPEAALTTVAVLLDIDVFMAAGPSESDDHLWETFELLRERKDKVFEACITDRTRELIN